MKLVLFTLLGVLATAILLCLVTPRFLKNRPTCGAFIQGVFRSNFLLLGLPLGVLLFLTSPRQLFEQKGLYALLSLIVNILRSLPFIILLIVMIPFTVLITGTSLGVAGAIPPLVVGATPFFAPRSWSRTSPSPSWSETISCSAWNRASGSF